MRTFMRWVLTVLMYGGVLVCLYPYVTERLTTGVFFMILGAGMTVVCGLLRCYLRFATSGVQSPVGMS